MSRILLFFKSKVILLTLLGIVTSSAIIIPIAITKTFGGEMPAQEGLDSYPDEATIIQNTGNTTLTGSADFSRFDDLSSIFLFGNQITSIDVYGNPKLFSLYFDTNNLSSLDVSENPELFNLNLRANQITSIDLSKNLNLNLADLRNNERQLMITLRTGQTISNFFHDDDAIIHYVDDKPRIPSPKLRNSNHQPIIIRPEDQT